MVDFTDSTRWELVFQQVLFSAWDARYRTLHVAPQQIEIVNSNGVLVEVLHQPERPSWRRAGRVRQLVTGFDGEVVRVGLSQRLYLETRNYFWFDFGTTQQWQLEVEFVEWLQRVQLSVWQYAGAGHPTQSMLEDLKTDLLRVEAKIDALSLNGIAPGSVSSGFNNSGTSSSLGIV